jgi:hypothetical protein
MTTQKALKLEKNMQQSDSLGNRNLMKLYMGQSWWARKMAKRTRHQRITQSRDLELKKFQRTVHALSQGTSKAFAWL